ncbi:MAG: hypothetical protein R3B71_00655 [Candidatus Gracilibacteria bacterium]|nr:hypothetical protein [Candidatus Peregrinibacteria bacterium]
MIQQEHNNWFARIRSHFHPTAVMIALVILLCAGNSVQFLQAQQTPTDIPAQSAAPEGEENSFCQADLTAFLATEVPRYNEWMESHFNNKSSTTSLLDDAFARYTDFRASLYGRYNNYFPYQGALQLSEGLELGECRDILEKALRSARDTLEQKAITTSTVKKTTALLQKYQSINGQLRNLYQSFITMKKHLDTFADKLPCYISKQCNK